MCRRPPPLRRRQPPASTGRLYHREPPVLIDHSPYPVDTPPRPDFDAESIDRRCRLAVRTQGLQPRQDLASLARRLGQTEGSLLGAHAGVFDRRESPLKTRRLRADWTELLAAAQAIGRHRLQLGNAIASLAIEVEAGGTSPLRQGDLHLGAWGEGHAVEECFDGGNVRRSLRFVDDRGRGVLALTLLDRARLADFYALVERFGALALCVPRRAGVPRPPACIGFGEPTPAQARAWREQWASMRDGNASDALVGALGQPRRRVLRALGADLAQPLAPGAVYDALVRAQASAQGVQTTVANAGAQLRLAWLPRRVGCERGVVVARGGSVRLRLDECALAEAWCVRLPGRTGLVHAIECFDRQGRLVLRLHGAAQAGRGESCDWRHLVHGLLAEAAP